MKLMRIAITLLSVMGIGVGSTNAQKAEIKRNIDVVTPKEFKVRLQSDTAAYLLDVRSHTEFAAGHVKGANQLNWLDSIAFGHGAGLLDKSKTIYVYCRSGHRSNLAARYLAAKGFKIVEMKGGFIAWTKNGLEIAK